MCGVFVCCFVKPVYRIAGKYGRPFVSKLVMTTLCKKWVTSRDNYDTLRDYCDTSRDNCDTSRDNCDTSRDNCDTSRDNCDGSQYFHII